MKFSLGFDSLVSRVLGFLKQDWGSCLLFFVVGLVLRGIPELLVSLYPVGYETITYYAPAMMLFAGQGLLDVFGEFFRNGPLFYVLMWFVVNVTGAHPFVVLKVVGPLLYGGLLVSFFVFLRRGLKFEWKLAFVGALLLSFQVAALRESWDRFRTVLGLVFLFFALAAMRSNFRSRWFLVGFLGVLTVLCREYVGFVLFVAVLGYAVLERRDRFVSLAASVPAVVIFAGMSYPLWGFWNYFSVENHFVTGSYLWMVQDAFSIFLLCYLPVLFFVVKGFWRDRLLLPIAGWLVLGSFSFVVSPWFGVPGYQRWLMLLVFPFSVYAVRGFERRGLFAKRRPRVLTAFVLVYIVVGAGYCSGVLPYGWLLPNSYVAGNMVQSSICWDQVDDVKAVLKWLDDNAAANSSVLVEERFYGWTLIYLTRANADVEIIPYMLNSPPAALTLALEEALSQGFHWIWMIWLTDSNMDGFQRVYSQNSVSIFQYETWM